MCNRLAVAIVAALLLAGCAHRVQVDPMTKAQREAAWRLQMAKFRLDVAAQNLIECTNRRGGCALEYGRYVAAQEAVR